MLCEPAGSEEVMIPVIAFKVGSESGSDEYAVSIGWPDKSLALVDVSHILVQGTMLVISNIVFKNKCVVDGTAIAKRRAEQMKARE